MLHFYSSAALRAQFKPEKYNLFVAFKLRVINAFYASFGEVLLKNAHYEREETVIEYDYSDDTDSSRSSAVKKMRYAKRKLFNPFKWAEFVIGLASTVVLLLCDAIDSFLKVLTLAPFLVILKPIGFAEVGDEGPTTRQWVFGAIVLILFELPLALTRIAFKSAYTLAFHVINFVVNFFLAPADASISPLRQLFNKRGYVFQKTFTLVVPIMLTILAVISTIMATGIALPSALFFLQPLATFITPVVTFLSALIGQVATPVVIGLAVLLSTLPLSRWIAELKEPLSTFLLTWINSGIKFVRDAGKYIIPKFKLVKMKKAKVKLEMHKKGLRVKLYPNERKIFKARTGFSQMLYNTPSNSPAVKHTDLSTGQSAAFAAKNFSLGSSPRAGNSSGYDSDDGYDYPGSDGYNSSDLNKQSPMI